MPRIRSKGDKKINLGGNRWGVVAPLRLGEHCMLLNPVRNECGCGKKFGRLWPLIPVKEYGACAMGKAAKS
jgi:hypothetical protein